MNTYAYCPCCSGKLIHHISHHRDYWFCRSCWQEMPLIQIKEVVVDNLNTKSKKSQSPAYVFQLRHAIG